MVPLPVEYLITLGALALGAFSLLLTLRVMSSKLALPAESARGLRRIVLDTYFNFFLIFVLAWKLSPLVFQFSTVASQPLALLYLPGGGAGAGLGLALALVYGALRLVFVPKKVPSEISGLFKKSFVTGTLVFLVLGSAALGLWTGSKTSGEMAPDFELSTLELQPLRLSSFHGQPVVLNFWASWCPPCRAEFPELAAFQKKWEGRAVLIGVNASNTERGESDAAIFLHTQEVFYPQLYDQEGLVQKLYGVTSLPTTIIIDPQGRILDRRVGAVTEALLSEILQKYAQ